LGARKCGVKDMVQSKLIAIDLDGTLLVNHRHISEENIATIREATSRGILIYLVSGRAISGMQPAAKALNLNTPLISLNGAYIFDLGTNETLFSRPIPREYANRAIDLFIQKGIYVGYHANLDWFVDRDCKEMRAEGKSMDRHPQFVESLQDAAIPAPHKLIAIDFDNEEILQEAYQELGKELPQLNAHFSETFALEIFDYQVSKATALQFILKKNQLSVENLMVIGDNHNDISMMQLAGLSVAMGNAPAVVKSHADWVVPTNENNGVAVAIKRLLNKQQRGINDSN
jgi:Cof subfamily protein (haloacid dehalogenase superfamily)